MPGLSFSGNMTLVRAVVEAGAVYYSDEHAMLDEVGRVHPYARPLPFRPPRGVRSTSAPRSWVGSSVRSLSSPPFC